MKLFIKVKTMNDLKKVRPPIQISKEDFERAYKKAEEFKRLLKKGKTREQIFKDMLRLVSVE
jgi:hypothetical protein